MIQCTLREVGPRTLSDLNALLPTKPGSMNFILIGAASAEGEQLNLHVIPKQSSVLFLLVAAIDRPTVGLPASLPIVYFGL